ncbi:hypothetical protein [Laspinema olomoucense]|uniref:Uncharacterized protein n=1 Tax=Laspinema olomoucense D3b TaxID=2953688 RepID=A0ABT2N7H3_9CYAN|nr:hypothetical protein [Laspinema sp. D3b]MCT7977670.1 hypothetical protein [Laspinema sp. D3b]
MTKTCDKNLCRRSAMNKKLSIRFPIPPTTRFSPVTGARFNPMALGSVQSNGARFNQPIHHPVTARLPPSTNESICSVTGDRFNQSCNRFISHRVVKSSKNR